MVNVTGPWLPWRVSCCPGAPRSEMTSDGSRITAAHAAPSVLNRLSRAASRTGGCPATPRLTCSSGTDMRTPPENASLLVTAPV